MRPYEKLLHRHPFVLLDTAEVIEEKGLAQLLAGTLGQDPSGQRRPPRRNPSEPGLPNARERPQGGLKTGKHMLGAPMVGLALPPSLTFATGRCKRS